MKTTEYFNPEFPNPEFQSHTEVVDPKFPFGNRPELFDPVDTELPTDTEFPVGLPLDTGSRSTLC